jgi:peptidoglycan/xylan/chitin deacetylase (PgdA/CDA1 family)
MRRPLILCHHAVSEKWPAALACTPAQLREQCAYLKRKGYEGFTLDGLDEGTGQSRAVALTFDDAFSSVWDLAKPILDEFGFPATIFVPTGYIEADGPMAWPGIDQWLDTEHEAELKPMTWDQLRECHSAGWQIGSHTVTHPRLTECSDAQLRSELENSRATCEAEIGARCTSLAYPYGDHDDRAVDATRAAGYASAVTLPQAFSERDPLRIPRVGVYRADDALRFRLKVAGPVLALRRTSVGPRLVGWARSATRR